MEPKKVFVNHYDNTGIPTLYWYYQCPFCHGTLYLDYGEWRCLMCSRTEDSFGLEKQRKAFNQRYHPEDHIEIINNKLNPDRQK
jgi:hypothetical protein